MLLYSSVRKYNNETNPQDMPQLEKQKLYQLCILVLNGTIVTNSKNENGC